MTKIYYELVFEGHHKAIHGLLEGYKLGAKIEASYFFSSEHDIKTETLAEIFLDWISLKNRIHHVILEEKLYESLAKSIEKKEKKNSDLISNGIIKSAKKIKNASFSFKAKTFAPKYAQEIRDILKNIPENTTLEDHKVTEETDREAKGVELYSPAHEYYYQTTGTITGHLGTLIEFRKKLTDYPLIEVDKIKINL